MRRRNPEIHIHFWERERDDDCNRFLPDSQGSQTLFY